MRRRSTCSSQHTLPLSLPPSPSLPPSLSLALSLSVSLCLSVSLSLARVRLPRVDMSHTRIARSRYFHSDFAHTDYIAVDPTKQTAAFAPGGAYWESRPLASPCTLRASRVKTVLWIGSNAVESEFTASLSRGTGDGNWTSLCGATANTLYREGLDKPLPLPGKSMVAASANGGFSVALPLELELEQEVELKAGDVLRLDVSCGAQSAASARERMDQRIWHNPKWASTVEVDLKSDGEAALVLPFEAHPVIMQPEVSML